MSTIDLFTGSVLSGNRSPPNWSAWENPPFDVVVDSHDGTMLADESAGGSRLLQVASGRVIGAYGAGGIAAFDPNRGAFFAAGGRSVEVISGASGRSLASVSTGSESLAAAFDPRTDEMLVTNPSSNNVTVLNASSDRIVGSIAVPGGPSLEAFDNTTGWLYVSTNGNVTVVNVSAGRVLGHVSDPYCPTALGVDPQDDQIWVANACYQNITIINGTDHQYLRDLASNGISGGLTFDPGAGRFYVTDPSANVLTVLNGSSDRILGFLTVGANMLGVAYDSANQCLYLTDQFSMTLETKALTGSRLRGSIGPAAIHPTSAAFDAARSWVFVANEGAGNVSILNATTDRPIRSASVGPAPYAAVYDPDNREVYIADSGSNTLTALNGSTGTVLRTIAVGADPQSLAVDPSTGDVFVDSGWTSFSTDVHVVDGRTDRVVRTLTLPNGYASGVAVDPTRAHLFVGGVTWPTSDTRVWEMDLTDWTWIANLSLGNNWTTTALAVDPAHGELYVAEVSWNGSAGVAAFNASTGIPDRWVGVMTGTLMLTVDETRGVLLITGENATRIDLIDLGTYGLLTAISVGAYTSGAAVDATTGAVWVGEPNRGLVGAL